jgi:tRNA(His) 5'-end guanylyltransferase
MGNVHDCAWVMVLVGIVLFFAIGGGIVYIKNQTNSKPYINNLMKIEFLYPSEYLLQKGTTSIVLIKGQSDNKSIIITESGTNFIDTKSHVDTSLLRKRVVPTIRTSINGVNVTGEVVEFKLNKVPYRIYYFVKNYMIYQLEANDPALFSDLDSIAKSFRILQ